MQVNVKVLAALAAAVCLAGCGKADRVVAGTGDVIRFIDYVSEGLDTRAYSENSVASVRQNGFTVACVTETNRITVFNEKAEWDGSISAYVTTSGIFYYPGNEAVSFYAAYPPSQSIGITSGSASLSYVSDPGTDLLAASRSGVTSRKTSVGLDFDHVLSFIGFRARGTDGDALYRLKKVTVSSPDGGVYRYADGKWTPSGSTSVVGAFSGDLAFLGTADVDAALTVVPCRPEIHVEWECWTTDGKTMMASYSESCTLEEALLPGEACTVTLVLSNRNGRPLVFDVEITAWGSDEQNINLE